MKKWDQDLYKDFVQIYWTSYINLAREKLKIQSM
jgi:hypothetical protein